MEFGLAYTEMVSSKGLFYNDEKTKLLLNTENEQIPVAAQIFGNDILIILVIIYIIIYKILLKKLNSDKHHQ